MKICEEHNSNYYEIGVVFCANNQNYVREGDCPICEEIKEKDNEIAELKRQIDVLEDDLSKYQ